MSTTQLDPAPPPIGAAGTEWLETNGLPERGDEAWRYTDVATLRAAFATSTRAESTPDVAPSLDSATPDGAVGTALPADVVAWHDSSTLVFVNGVLSLDLSRVGHIANGLRLDRTGPAKFVAAPVDGFDALNWASHSAGAAISTVTGSTDGFVQVVHLSIPSAVPTVAHPRTVIDVAPGSELTVVETFIGGGEQTLTNAATAIRIGDDAQLHFHRTQFCDPASMHVGHTNVVLGTRAGLRMGTFDTGAAIAHHRVDIGFAGDDSSASIAGLYTPGAQQHHDTMIRVDHASSGCTSDQHLRGVIADHGRGAFSGAVVVGAGSSRTHAAQLNHNILLGPHAEADSRPWLEIYSDDVSCTHGSSVGRLDDDALFYLRSRGIAVGDARRILIEAFVREVIESVVPPSVRTWLRGRFAPPIQGEPR
jgi:Fe-S cluster assembly protein SufD